MALPPRPPQADIDRLLDQRVEQGLPRKIEDDESLDRVAAIIVAARKTRGAA